MMSPGGPHTYARWPAEESLHNIRGLIPGDESDPKNVDWMVESCGRFEVMANPNPDADFNSDDSQNGGTTADGNRSK